MILCFLGRSAWPDVGIETVDHVDQAVIKRSHALDAGVFHGMVRVKVRPDRERSVVALMEGHGWTLYRPKASP